MWEDGSSALKKSQKYIAITGLCAVFLILGVAFGSLEFPTAKIEYQTATETQTSYILIIQNNKSSLTATIEVLNELVEHMQLLTSANCTILGGTASIGNTTETVLVIPSQIENTTGFASATITTETTTIQGIASTDLTTTSFDIHEYGNAVQTIVSTRSNGVVVTATCPIAV